MARTVITWPEGERLRLTEVLEGGATVVGRSQDCGVPLDDRTVSRQHALIKAQEGLFFIENLSQTNPTKVNDVAIDRPVPLSDGDVIGVGSIALTFHDLAAGDRISGPMCSHCSRENMASDKDCWYCGTSLVNAATVTLRRREAVCRAVGRDGSRVDLTNGEALVAREADVAVVKADERPADAAAVTVREGRAVLAIPAAGAAATLNGKPVSNDAPLSTGDETQLGESYFLLVVR